MSRSLSARAASVVVGLVAMAVTIVGSPLIPPAAAAVDGASVSNASLAANLTLANVSSDFGDAVCQIGDQSLQVAAAGASDQGLYPQDRRVMTFAADAYITGGTVPSGYQVYSNPLVTDGNGNYEWGANPVSRDPVEGLWAYRMNLPEQPSAGHYHGDPQTTSFDGPGYYYFETGGYHIIGFEVFIAQKGLDVNYPPTGTTDPSACRWYFGETVAGTSMTAAGPMLGSAVSLAGPNPAMGQQCPACHGGTDHSVDSLTGNEHWAMPGVRLSARGPGIDFQMAYNSQAARADDSIGHGWLDSYDMSLSSGDFGTEVVTQETGATVPFIPTGSNWVAPPQYDATLMHNSDGTWLFTRHHRELFSFDSSGRLTAIADRNGYTTTLSYGADGLDHVVDDAGHRLDFAWSNGHVSTITDVSDPDNPRTMRFSYDSGDLTLFGDIGGGSWPMSYDNSHRLLSVQSPRLAGSSAARQFHYDDQGRVDWEQDAEGQRTSLYYGDPQPGATRIVDPAGNARVDYYNDLGQRTSVTSGYGSADASTTQYVYDSSTGMVTNRIDGRSKQWHTEYGDPANPFSPTKTTDPANRIRTMTYTPDGDPDLVTDAHGVQTKYEYDANGNPKSITAAYGTADAEGVQYFYDDADQPGVPTKIVDADNQLWTFDHDPATGELLKATDPLGNATTWTYNPEGWVSTKVAPKGNAPGGTPKDYTTSYQYNAYGEPTLVTDALGHDTHASYYPGGNKESLIDATGRETDYTWTVDDQLKTVTQGVGTPSARTLTYTYWPDGNVKTWFYQPDSVWSLSWDALGRLSKQTDPNGDSTTYGYNATGQPTSTTVAAGSTEATTTTAGYDDDGRPAITTVGDGTADAMTTTTNYDIAPGTAPCQNGPTSTVYCVATTQAGQQMVRFYDARDRLVKATRPGGKSTAYSYDAAGLLRTSTAPSGDVTQYDYYDNGQLKSASNGEAADDVSYVYDANGDRRSMTDATGTTQYVFDHDQRLTSVTDAANKEVQYGFDDAGRIQSLTYPDSRLVTYSYNGAGQMASLTDDIAGQQTDFGYNADGALTSTALPNGDAITTDVDSADQPMKRTLTGPAGAALASIGYDHDHAGRISAETDQGALSAAASYGYDALSRLRSVTDGASATSTYGYDTAGNPAILGATTQTFDTDGELKTSTSNGTTTSFDYDGNGNRTRGSPTTGSNTHYHYDKANRLTSATIPDPNPPGSQYHPLGITRLVDTRNGTGQCSPSACATLSARGTLTIQVAGKGGVPSTGVKAVVLNVTALNSTANGLLVAYPAGQSRPNGRSLSTISGTEQSNAVVTALSADGKVTFYSGVNTDLLIDVSGWYSDPDDQTGSVFEPIDGTRILDTRNGTGSCAPSCTRVAAGGTTTVQVGGKGGVPATGVTAVAFTLTAFDPSKSGYATVWPADQTQPSQRNLSYSASTDSSQLIVARPSATGQLKLYTLGAADFTIDLAGYYTTSTDGTGSIFVPYDGNSGTQPQRVLDTRNGTGDCSPATCDTVSTTTPLTVTVAGHGNVPTGATAAVLSATAWAPTGDGALVFWSADDSKPSGRNLSYAAGATTTGSIQVPLSEQGQIKATALFHATDLTLDVEGWFEPATPTTTSYTYNGDGLRTTKTDSAKNTTHYTYNPATPVPELLTDGTTDYIYGPSGLPLESAATPGANSPKSFYLTDANGSTRALTDSTGAIAGTYDYTPFGAVADHTGTATTPLEYAGGYTDPETGLGYLINRYYDPGTGVFTSADPLVNLTNTPYTYADNNPINETDPTGACPWCVGAAIGAAAGAGLDLGKQLLHNVEAGCPAFNNISWGEVGESALAGAAAGATMGIGEGIAGLGVGIEEAGGAEALAANGADNVVNGTRLAQQLARESADSVFTSSGRLSSGAIADSKEIISGSRLGNKDLISRLTSDGSDIADWGKYTTRTAQSPSGDFQVHFYMNRVTGAVDYGYDYKVIFNGAR